MFNRFICIACGTKLQGNDFSCPKCHNTTSIIPLPPEMWEYDRDDGKKTATYLPVGWSSFDKALGGGLARSSMTTLCGDEGIGKSTLSLQIGDAVAQQGKSVFYVNTEEHKDVLVKRAQRLKTTSQNLVIEAGKTWQKFINELNMFRKRPDLIIVDSLSRFSDEEEKARPDTLPQIKRCGMQLLQLAKVSDWAVLTDVHTTKGGVMAGHKGLGYDSDVNLYLEKDVRTGNVVMISKKNRVGATDDIVFFKMEAGGLFIIQPDTTPHKAEPQIGVSYAVILYEGRPLVIEVQASRKLPVVKTTKTKTIEVFNKTRASSLIKLLSYLGVPVNNYDIFLRAYAPKDVKDEVADLSVITALLSAFEQFSLPNDTVYLGKVDYDGNILSTADIDDRLESTHSRGFKKCISGVDNKNISFKGIENIQIENIREIIPYFTGGSE